MALWQTEGENISGSVQSFTESLEIDYRLYPYDIEASIVWAEALAISGAIPHSDFEEIRDELTDIEQEFEDGSFELDPELEDIHMNIESELIDRLGDTGARIHFGRSRNDQVLVDVKLYLKDVLMELNDLVRKLVESLVDRAEEHKETLLPGYTHLQPAQPIRLAHYLLAYAEKFRRDANRLWEAYRATDVLPLGSAALAGSGADIDREFLARELDFGAVSRNSMDAVSERDFMADTLHALNLIGLHASRLCEDWILWSSPSFGFARMADEHTTGSSIMPQKQNPDVAELIRGHAGRLASAYQGLSTVLKAQPMTYNRDLQEDKVHLFRAIDSVGEWLPLLTDIVKEISFDTETMQQALEQGYPGATDLADYLVEKGVPFREAHHAVREVVQKAVEQDKTLKQLEIGDYVDVHTMFDPNIFELLEPKESTARRDLPGGTGPTAVTQQIDGMRSWLETEQT